MAKPDEAGAPRPDQDYEWVTRPKHLRVCVTTGAPIGSAHGSNKQSSFPRCAGADVDEAISS